MSVAHALIAFTLTAGLLTATPGLDMALVLRTAVVEGRRRALMAGFGVCCGVLVWGLAGSVGLSALLAISVYKYDALRIAGACYLTYLGVRLLLRTSPWRAANEKKGDDPLMQSTANESGSRWFGRGFLTNILNPKVGVFYISFLPQFIPSGVHVLTFSMLLALIHAAEGLIWFLILTRATEYFSRRLRQPSVLALLDKATGAVFIGFALKLAFEKGR